MKRHSIDLVAMEFREESKKKCREWKDSETFEEAQNRYVDIID